MNILQIEDDLKGMPTDVIVQHLQNPTGLIPTYLAAGELNRREKMQVARAEAPQETVVDEIIQKAMPMGGMPMPQAPMPQMPMPRPEEVMVSDTITETGIAGLPAPNVGNYKEGGIVGYDNGGIVYNALDYADRGLDYAGNVLDNPVVQGIETALFPRLSLAMGLLPQEAQAATLYDDEDFADIIEAEKNVAQEMALGGAGAAGTIAAKQKLANKKTAAAKKTAAKRTKAKRKPTKTAAGLFGLRELIKKGKDKFKPQTKKKQQTGS